MTHQINVCDRGFVHSQCRCPSRDKQIQVTHCEMSSHRYAKGQYWDDPAVSKFVEGRVLTLTKELQEYLNR